MHKNLNFAWGAYSGEEAGYCTGVPYYTRITQQHKMRTLHEEYPAALDIAQWVIIFYRSDKTGKVKHTAVLCSDDEGLFGVQKSGGLGWKLFEESGRSASDAPKPVARV